MKDIIKEALVSIRLLEDGARDSATQARMQALRSENPAISNAHNPFNLTPGSATPSDSNPSKVKQIANRLTSKGVEVVGNAKQAAAKVAAKIGGSAAGKLVSRVLPGVGLVVGTMDAIDRAKKGDWTGAGIAGLAAVMSLGGPLTAGASLGLGAYNLYRDHSSKEGEKPEGGAETPAPGTEPVNTQPTKGGPAPDPEIQAMQKKILAKDPNALPKYGADGRMGPETQAALAKYVMSTESQQTVAEGIRSLQERIDLIEAKAVIRESLEQTYFLDKNYFMYDKSGEQVVDLLTISVINEAVEQGQIKIKKLS
jgi:hypothetical protein